MWLEIEDQWGKSYPLAHASWRGVSFEAERSGNEDLRRLLLEVPKAQQLSIFRLRVSELADGPYFSFSDSNPCMGRVACFPNLSGAKPLVSVLDLGSGGSWSRFSSKVQGRLEGDGDVSKEVQSDRLGGNNPWIKGRENVNLNRLDGVRPIFGKLYLRGGCDVGETALEASGWPDQGGEGNHLMKKRINLTTNSVGQDGVDSAPSCSQDEKWQWCLAETNKTDLQKSAKALLVVGLFRIQNPSPHRFSWKLLQEEDMESFTNGIKSAQGGVDTVFDDDGTWSWNPKSFSRKKWTVWMFSCYCRLFRENFTQHGCAAPLDVWQVPWPSCRMTSRMLCSNMWEHPWRNLFGHWHFLVLGITTEASGVLKLMNVIWLLWVLSASFEHFEDSKKQTWSWKKHSSVSPVWFWVGYWLFYPASYFLKFFEKNLFSNTGGHEETLWLAEEHPRVEDGPTGAGLRAGKFC